MTQPARPPKGSPAREGPRPLSPVTLGIEVPRGEHGEVRCSIALLGYNRATYADLRVKKVKGDGHHENMVEQHQRIARALFNHAQTEPNREMYISLNAPQELEGEYRKLFLETLAHAFQHHRPGYQIGFKYGGSAESLSLILKHARERGNWASLTQDMQAYFTSFSNGDYTATTVMTVAPRVLSWRSLAIDNPDALEATLHHLRDLLPDVHLAYRLGVWTNSETLNKMIAGQSVTLKRDQATLAKAITEYRKTRDITLTGVPNEDKSLQRLGFHLGMRALSAISEKKLLTPRMTREAAQRDATPETSVPALDAAPA